MSTVYDALTKAAAEKPKTMDALNPSWSGINQRSKIAIFVFSVLFLIIVNQLVARVLRRQMEETALLMTTNLSDAAATYLASKDLLQLDTTVTKYARLNRVAYVFVRDRDGNVIAHSLRSFPPELAPKPASDHGHREVSRREITVDGKTVYETSGPILEGRLGSAHIGISAAAVESDIYETLFLSLWPLALGILAVAIIFTVGSRLLLERFPSFWFPSRR
jgi:sensor histidine kinase regulating citrate/malate metabolism